MKVNLFKVIKVIVNKVIDHCHYTRKYCGAAHSICNLCYKENNFILVMAHNASN